MLSRILSPLLLAHMFMDSKEKDSVSTSSPWSTLVSAYSFLSSIVEYLYSVRTVDSQRSSMNSRASSPKMKINQRLTPDLRDQTLLASLKHTVRRRTHYSSDQSAPNSALWTLLIRLTKTRLLTERHRFHITRRVHPNSRSTNHFLNLVKSLPTAP